MNRTVSQCPQQHTHAHTPSPPVSINPRTTNKRNPDAAALSGPRMADTMASDTEPSALPNAEQSAVVPEAEVSSPTPRSPPSRTSPSSCENSAPSDPSTRTTSTETTNKPQPPTKTVESVRRKVVDVAMEAGPRVVSGVWLFYRKVDKPINKKGQNTQCQVKASPALFPLSHKAVRVRVSCFFHLDRRDAIRCTCTTTCIVYHHFFVFVAFHGTCPRISVYYPRITVYIQRIVAPVHRG